jgi:hypothetical protein
VLKGQDILLLLKLCDEPGNWSVRSLAAAVEIDPAGAHRALRRLEEARLVDRNRRRVNRSNAREFLVHGLKYEFPPRQGGMSRGLPTAWAAPPLSDMLASADEPPLVWPDAKGKVRGVALEPLHESAPRVARRDPAIAEKLALLDAIRVGGGGRVRGLAAEELTKRLRAPAAA